MRFFFVLVLISLSAFNCTLQESKAASLMDHMSFVDNDSVLFKIESRVENALAISLLSKSSTELDKINTQLVALTEVNKNNRVVSYWRAYNYYYTGVFHFVEENKEKTIETLQLGIDILESISGKSSEELALLAMLQSFTMSSSSSFAIPVIASKVKRNNINAMKLDDKNPRAYYVAALNDFYTPAQYKGGKLVEKYAKKAIELPAQQQPNPYMPSWGKKMAYELLVKFYIREKRTKEAQELYKVALTDFPEDYQLMKLGTELLAADTDD